MKTFKQFFESAKDLEDLIRGHNTPAQASDHHPYGFDLHGTFPEGSPGSMEHFVHHTIGWLNSITTHNSAHINHIKALEDHHNNVPSNEYFMIHQKHRNNPKSVDVPDDARAIWRKHNP